MKIIVNDANILIDLIKLRLLPHFFALDFHFHLTNLVLNELIDVQADELSPYRIQGTLQVYEVSAKDFLRIYQLTSTFPQLSANDCSALNHANLLNAILLTSDNQLKKTAQSINVEVHGHLWVFDAMVHAQTITPEKAIEKLLELIKTINPKLGLPKSECQKRLNSWSRIGK